MITEFILEPVGVSFDVAAVEAYLLTLPHTVRDEIQREMFMIGDRAANIADAREARRRDRVRFPSNVILVHVTPDRIRVSHETTEVQVVRRFVEWLRAQCPLRVLDYEFNDLTDYCKDDLAFLFGDN